MLEIDGIPPNKEENSDRQWCKNIVKKIHSLMRLPSESHGIDVAHCTKSGTIIVLFNTRSKRGVLLFQI